MFSSRQKIHFEGHYFVLILATQTALSEAKDYLASNFGSLYFARRMKSDSGSSRMYMYSTLSTSAAVLEQDHPPV